MDDRLLDEIEEFFNTTKEYGFLGNNFTQNIDRGFYQTNTDYSIEYTLDNYFMFGYNMGFNNYRRSSSCIYTTDYAPDVVEYSTWYDEFSKTLKLIKDRYGSFAVTITCPFGELIVNHCRQLDIHPLVIRPDYNDSNFEEFASIFCNITRCYKMEYAWAAFALEYTDLPVIFDTDSVMVANYSYYLDNYFPVCLVDQEQQTTINRYLNSIRRVSFPNILRYTGPLLFSTMNDLKPFDMKENVNSTDNIFFKGELPLKLKSMQEHYLRIMDKSNELSLVSLGRMEEMLDVKFQTY